MIHDGTDDIGPAMVEDKTSVPHPYTAVRLSSAVHQAGLYVEFNRLQESLSLVFVAGVV